MERRHFLIAAGMLAGWSLRPDWALAAPAAILEMKLLWVNQTASGTAVQLVLNACARGTFTHPLTGEVSDILVRSTRRTFSRTFAQQRTPQQCMALLRQFLVDKAAEDGSEVIQ